MPNFFSGPTSTPNSSNSSSSPALREDESHQLTDHRAAAAAQTWRYRARCEQSASPFSLSCQLPRPSFLTSPLPLPLPLPLPSPSHPNVSDNAMVAAGMRRYRARATSASSVPSNPSLRPLLPRLYSLAPPSPNLHSDTTGTSSIENDLLQAADAIASMRRSRVISQAQPQFSVFTVISSSLL